MNYLKKNSLAKALLFAMVVGLSMGLAASAFAATTNTASSTPPILIGASGTTSSIVITESAFGALATGSEIRLELPTGVTFSAAPTVVVDATNTNLLTVEGNTAVRNDDSTEATFTIAGTPTSSAGLLIINGLPITLAATVAEGDISVTITSGPPANPGLTPGELVVAEAVTGSAVSELAATAPNVAIGGEGAAAGIIITELTAAAFADNATIDLELPDGVTFDSTSLPTSAITEGTGTDLGINTNAVLSNSDSTATWTITNPSSDNAELTLTIPNIIVESTVDVGAINATLSSSDGVLEDTTLAIANAANKGITLTAVNSADYTAFDDDPTALAEDDINSTPAGRVNFAADALMIVENFAGDLSINPDDTLTVTLPTGVTFADAPTISGDNLGAGLTIDTVPDPSGFSTLNITIAGQSSGAQGGFLIDGITLNIDASIAAGDIVATVSGTVDGTDITPLTAVIAQVVEAGVEIEANETIPTRGIGTTNAAIGEFTITETVNNALLGNAATIVVTLPTGVTFYAAPTATVDDASDDGATSLVLASATWTSGSGVATFNVTTASGDYPALITIEGDIDIASTVAPGDIVATISGTAGASGTVTIATAADAVAATAGSIPSLTAGLPTQPIANLILTEAFAGGLANGEFRLLTSAGAWATATPTITVTPSSVTSTTVGDDDTTTDWYFELGQTYAANDTLIVSTPDTVSTQAATITLTGLKLNLPAGVAEGEVLVSLVDGDLAADNGTGIKAVSLTMGYIGTPEALAATPETVSVAVEATADITVTGGIDGYSATSDDDTIATVSVSDGTVTVTGVAEGTATITITDSAATPSSITVDVTVTAAVPATEIDTTPGPVAVSATADEELGLNLNVTPTEGDTPAQQWLVVTFTVGDTDFGWFVYSSAAGFVQVGAEGWEDVQYDFSGAVDGLADLGSLSMGALTFTTGDTFTYGYAYTTTASDFSTLVFNNIVTITVQ